METELLMPPAMSIDELMEQAVGIGARAVAAVSLFWGIGSAQPRC